MILDAHDWDFEYKNGEIHNLIDYTGLKVEIKDTVIRMFDNGESLIEKQIIVSFINKRSDVEDSFQLLSPRDVNIMKDIGMEKSWADYYVKQVVHHIQCFGKSKDAQIVWDKKKEPKVNKETQKRFDKLIPKLNKIASKYLGEGK